MQHQSPAFSRRKLEHTDRNVELKPTVPFRTTPTHLEMLESLHGVTANLSISFSTMLSYKDDHNMLLVKTVYEKRKM